MGGNGNGGNGKNGNGNEVLSWYLVVQVSQYQLSFLFTFIFAVCVCVCFITTLQISTASIFLSRDLCLVILLLRTKFHVNQTINRWDRTEKRFSIWWPSAILNLQNFTIFSLGHKLRKNGTVLIFLCCCCLSFSEFIGNCTLWWFSYLQLTMVRLAGGGSILCCQAHSLLPQSQTQLMFVANGVCVCVVCTSQKNEIPARLSSCQQICHSCQLAGHHLTRYVSWIVEFVSWTNLLKLSFRFMYRKCRKKNDNLWLC